MMRAPLQSAAVAMVLCAAALAAPVRAAALIDTQAPFPPDVCMLDATRFEPEPATVLPPIIACRLDGHRSTPAEQG